MNTKNGTGHGKATIERWQLIERFTISLIASEKFPNWTTCASYAYS